MKKKYIILFLILVTTILFCSCNKRIAIYSTITSGLSSHPNTYNLPDSLTDGRFEFYSIEDSTQIRLKGGFKNGKKHGKWVKYYRNGSLESINRYRKGDLFGKQKDYYSNGQLQVLWKFNNYRIEYIKMFDEEGNKLTKEEFFRMYL
jgi:hypothetical protein